MTYVLLILLVAAVVGFLWYHKQQQGAAQKAPSTPPRRGAAPPKEDRTADETTSFMAAVTKLTTMDAPMIQARLEKLGIFDELEAHQVDRLKKLIKEHCQEGREEPWWGPLQEFAKGLRFQKGNMPCVVISSRPWKGSGLRKDIDSISYMIRDSGVELDDVQRMDGKPLHSEDDVKDEEYRVLYKKGERKGDFSLRYRNNILDVIDLARSLNGLLAVAGDSHRFFVLPPMDPHWCLVHTVLPAAERAAQSKWGRLPLPRQS